MELVAAPPLKSLWLGTGRSARTSGLEGASPPRDAPLFAVGGLPGGEVDVSAEILPFPHPQHAVKRALLDEREHVVRARATAGIRTERFRQQAEVVIEARRH